MPQDSSGFIPFPIVFAQCASCHRPGEVAPFPLLTYADARKHGAKMADETRERRIFNDAGLLLATRPFSLKPGEQQQIGRIISNSGVANLEDGRIEFTMRRLPSGD